jgi:hypothetical protein
MPEILFLVLILAPPLITALVMVNALQSGSYLIRATKFELVFLAPVSTVVFIVALFILIAWMCVAANVPHFFLINWQSIFSNRSNIAFAGALGIAVVGLYWGGIRWYQKRCPLVLDLERRSYRTVDVNSVNLRTHTGSWEDIAGIYVNRASAKGTVTFYVRLKWKGPKKFAAVMGGFSKQKKAEAFAQQMARELGLPLVASSC